MPRPRRSAPLALLLLLFPLASATFAQGPQPLGFSPATAATHREAERKAMAVPTPADARRWLRAIVS